MFASKEKIGKVLHNFIQYVQVVAHLYGDETLNSLGFSIGTSIAHTWARSNAMKTKLTLSKSSTSLQSRAQSGERRLQDIYHSSYNGFIETGHIIIEFERDELWKHRFDAEGNPYRSMDHWIRTALPYGRATAKAAADMVRKFEGIDDKTLQQVPRVNLELIARLPPAKRKSPKWIQAAIELPGRVLRLQVRENVPQEVGPRNPNRVTFVFSDSGYKLMLRAMVRAANELGDKSAAKELCLATIFTVYLAATARSRAA